jgi:signal transduction histidine kinase
LAICQSIVLAHGGRIQVANAPGGGARFSVFLPTQVHPRRFASN